MSPAAATARAACTGRSNARDPRTDRFVTVRAPQTPGADRAPDSQRQRAQRNRRSWDGIAETVPSGLRWSSASLRHGVDLTGNRTHPACRAGVLHGRTGNTVFSIPQPPLAAARDLRNGQLQTLGSGGNGFPVPADPSSTKRRFRVWQWQAGLQRALPGLWRTISRRRKPRLQSARAFQGGTRIT